MCKRIWADGASGLPDRENANNIAESMDGVISDGAVNLVQNMFDFEELQVVAVNNSAEFSRVANFTMTGRGGTNQFHGRAFYDITNSFLNARNTFAPYKVPYKEHRGAGSISRADHPQQDVFLRFLQPGANSVEHLL